MSTEADLSDFTSQPSSELEFFTQCIICLEVLTSPKLLPCGHSFCLVCLEKFQQKHTQAGTHENEQIQCPTCRSIHNLPDGLVENLPSDHRVNSLKDWAQKQKEKNQEQKECDESQEVCCTVCHVKGIYSPPTMYCFTCRVPSCTKCTENHSKNLHFKEHVTVEVEGDAIKALLCQTHERQLVSSFCQDCMQPVCQICLLEEHNCHAHVGFHVADETCLSKFSTTKNNITFKLRELMVEKEWISETGNANEDGSKETKNRVKSLIDEQIRSLQENEAIIENEQGAVCRATDKVLKEFEAEIDLAVTQMTDLLETIDSRFTPLSSFLNITPGNATERIQKIITTIKSPDRPKVPLDFSLTDEQIKDNLISKTYLQQVDKRIEETANQPAKNFSHKTVQTEVTTTTTDSQNGWHVKLTMYHIQMILAILVSIIAVTVVLSQTTCPPCQPTENVDGGVRKAFKQLFSEVGNKFKFLKK